MTQPASIAQRDYKPGEFIRIIAAQDFPAMAEFQGHERPGQETVTLRLSLDLIKKLLEGVSKNRIIPDNAPDIPAAELLKAHASLLRLEPKADTPGADGEEVTEMLTVFSL